MFMSVNVTFPYFADKLGDGVGLGGGGPAWEFQLFVDMYALS
jgi:hypothetical protein